MREVGGGARETGLVDVQPDEDEDDGLGWEEYDALGREELGFGREEEEVAESPIIFNKIAFASSFASRSCSPLNLYLLFGELSFDDGRGDKFWDRDCWLEEYCEEYWDKDGWDCLVVGSCGERRDNDGLRRVGVEGVRLRVGDDVDRARLLFCILFLRSSSSHDIRKGSEDYLRRGG